MPRSLRAKLILAVVAVLALVYLFVWIDNRYATHSADLPPAPPAESRS
jgi:hypothetical protein